jgi:iron complex transport system substrate-binding protein
MKAKYRFGLFLAVLLLTGILLTPASAVWGAKSSQFELIERDGTKVTLANIPRRVVVLTQSTAQVLWHLGVKPVGITPSPALPQELQGISQVGMGMRPDLEKIKSLRPDLVISFFGFKSTLKSSFAEHGIPAYFIDDQRYTDTLNNITQLGAAFNRREQARKLLETMKERERKILSRIAGKPSPKVMIIFGTANSFMLAGEKSFAGDLVKILKGTNITGLMKGVKGPLNGYMPLSLENVVALNPDIILRISHGNPGATQAIFRKEFSENPIWKQLSAVQQKRVYDLEPKLFFANPGLQCSDALEKLADLLYRTDNAERRR